MAIYSYLPLISRLTLLAFVVVASATSIVSAQTEPSKILNTNIPGAGFTYSSPVVAEIDGDESNGLEIAVAGVDGKVHVVHADGSLLWSQDLPNASCPTSLNKVLSSPAVGDLDGNGIAEVVVGYGGLGGKACGGGVVAFNGRTGERAWHFDTKAFAKGRFGVPVAHSVVSTPALADVDGDGTMEIGFGSYDRNIYLLNSQGQPIWYYNAADTVWSSAAFANVNADPYLEMIIGTDISGNSRLNPPTKNGGFVYALRTVFNTRAKARKKRKGIRPPSVIHFSFRDPSIVIWQRAMNQTVFSAPVVGELIPENPGPEIAVGSGYFFPQGTSNKNGREVTILSGKTGKRLRKLATPAPQSSSPALGDINGDGNLEVVTTVLGLQNYGGDGQSHVMAWNPRTGQELWSTVPRGAGGNDEALGDFTSAVIADIDHNGSAEVIVGQAAGVVVLDGTSGSHLTCEDLDCSPRLRIGGPTRSTPAVADINLDGKLDVIAIGSSNGKGAIVGWTNFEDSLGSPSGNSEPGYAPWPMYRGNARRSGVRAE